MMIVYENEPYTVLECEHAKLGRGSAFCRTKLKNLKTSQLLDCTLRDSDNIEEACVEIRKLQHLYHQGNVYHFLDLETYEDFILDKSHIEDKLIWLKDNLELSGIFYNNEFINLELPSSLTLRVIETNPGYKGDTVKSGTKPAKLETGLSIQVPLFINTGDMVKVDTRTKEYLGRI
jgi:elongation factor P